MSIDVWYEQIEEAPDDWELRLQFADWLEEDQEPVLAAGQRWQAKHRRRPYQQPDTWEWFYFQDDDQLSPGACVVPYSLGQHFRDLGCAERYPNCPQFDSIREAEAALAEALHRMESL